VNFEEGLARVVMSKDADPQAYASALLVDKYAATLRP
jgi:hypothetical protein